MLVAFDRGDTRVPYVIGQLYNGVDKPLHDGQIVDAGAGQVTKRGLVSRKGHELLFDEDKGIRLSTGDGSYRLELDASGTVITIDSGGTISIHGTGKITIKGDSDVDLSAGGNLQLTAANIKIAADAQLDLGGGGVAKLHAGVVQIN